MKKQISVTVNGVTHQNEIEPRLLLVQYIRDVLNLTGTHVGCETSLCGACTVMVDGQAVKSCTMLAAQADGSTVTTIEGLAQGGELHPVQNGFWEHHGLQCGYCTPGMIMAAAQILQRNPDPDGRRDSARAGRKSLPLYRIPEYCAGSAMRGEKDEVEVGGKVAGRKPEKTLPLMNADQR